MQKVHGAMTSRKIKSRFGISAFKTSHRLEPPVQAEADGDQGSIKVFRSVMYSSLVIISIPYSQPFSNPPPLKSEDHSEEQGVCLVGVFVA